MRVKVTARMSSIAMPAATNLVVRAAMVNVLPVPALASSTMIPGAGRGPHGSNGNGSVRFTYRSSTCS